MSRYIIPYIIGTTRKKKTLNADTVRHFESGVRYRRSPVLSTPGDERGPDADRFVIPPVARFIIATEKKILSRVVLE